MRPGIPKSGFSRRFALKSWQDIETLVEAAIESTNDDAEEDMPTYHRAARPTTAATPSVAGSPNGPRLILAFLTGGATADLPDGATGAAADFAGGADVE